MKPIFEFSKPSRSSGLHDFTLGIVGSGGDGVITSGEIIEGTLSSQGLYCMLTKSFGPQIRGGETYAQLRVSDAALATEGDALDLAVVLSWKDFKRFLYEVKLRPGATLIHDPDDTSGAKLDLPIDEERLRSAIEIPFARLAKESGSAKNKNMVLLGVLCHMVGIAKDTLSEKIAGQFRSKGEALVTALLKSFEAGHAYASEHVPKSANADFADVMGRPKCVMTGNEAVAFGALYAGCRFFAGYPITPSTEVMEFMSRYLPRYGGRCVQVEDEIAAIGMCVGATFAGVKSMTSTSGPGMSLMSEMLGLASIAELPLVICDVQRVGPSTGIPTKSEQSDLLHACFGGHGDAARVVIAPCDVEDCFDVTVKAFYIAELYQVPVIVLSDQLIGQRKEAIDTEGVINELEGFIALNERPAPSLSSQFRRYAPTRDGVPRITRPGTPGGMYQISGLEHDERGRPTSSFACHDEMAKRRAAKLGTISDEFQFLRWYGPKEADLGILAWGSSKGAVKDAVFEANRQGKSVAALIPQIIYPVPEEQIAEFIGAMKRIAVIELSTTAQFFKLIHSAVNLPPDAVRYARPGANPLRTEEVLEIIDRALASGPDAAEGEL